MLLKVSTTKIFGFGFSSQFCELSIDGMSQLEELANTHWSLIREKLTSKSEIGVAPIGTYISQVHTSITCFLPN